MNLTTEQLQILRHMLGINRPNVKDPVPYRDYYCAGYGDSQMVDLARLGAVRLYRQSDYYDWYATTDAGRAAALASHKCIRWSKSKRVYSMFLAVSDAIPGLTFREFLTNPVYAASRESA